MLDQIVVAEIKIAAEPVKRRRDFVIWVAAARLPHFAVQTNGWSGSPGRFRRAQPALPTIAR